MPHDAHGGHAHLQPLPRLHLKARGVELHDDVLPGGVFQHLEARHPSGRRRGQSGGAGPEPAEEPEDAHHSHGGAPRGEADRQLQQDVGEREEVADGREHVEELEEVVAEAREADHHRGHHRGPEKGHARHSDEPSGLGEDGVHAHGRGEHEAVQRAARQEEHAEEGVDGPSLLPRDAEDAVQSPAGEREPHRRCAGGARDEP
mmetsp:Transcript_91939/g.256967  ORF Transcript_91939/g.256967 Transcript_91939/m.256967 type:complete len:203 (+) Transcript_91939:469-1077(+)